MIIKLYDETVTIEFKEASHRYKVDGSFKPGVSSILGVLNKDLMDWAVFMAVGSFRDAVEPYVTSSEYVSKMAFKTIQDQAKNAHKQRSQRGKDVGSIVHAWIKEETDKDQFIEIPEYVQLLASDGVGNYEPEVLANLKAAEHCMSQWRQWKEDYDVEVIVSEQVVYSQKLGYCGTFDLLFLSRRTGKVYLGDYKTSEPQKIRNSRYQITGYKPYPEHIAQIAGYDYAYSEETGTEVDGYAVIYLPKEGDYQMFTRENVAEDRQGWENLFKTYDWLTKVKRSK